MMDTNAEQVRLREAAEKIGWIMDAEYKENGETPRWLFAARTAIREAQADGGDAE